MGWGLALRKHTTIWPAVKIKARNTNPHKQVFVVLFAWSKQFLNRRGGLKTQHSISTQETSLNIVIYNLKGQVDHWSLS
jgi:hypothetical protein